MIYNAFVKSKTKNIINSLDDSFRIFFIAHGLILQDIGFFGSMSDLSGQALENKKFQVNLLDKIIIIELYII
jgi:hypothetical protein